MECNLYILLDAARMGTEIIYAKKINHDNHSLYRGKSELSLSFIGPYLFAFNPQNDFGKWFMQNGWGESWGLMAYSRTDLNTLVKHFRHFLMVKNEDGEKLYFRFYDPRVLRIFLPTCDRRQLMDFFGLIEYFICEDENPEMGLLFSLEKGELKTERIRKEEIPAFHPGITKKKFGWL